MTVSFNEFQRELINRKIQPNEAYMFTLVYERLAQVVEDVQENARVLLALAKSMENFVALHEGMEKRLQRLARGQSADGVDVHSVAHDPDDV